MIKLLSSVKIAAYSFFLAVSAFLSTKLFSWQFDFKFEFSKILPCLISQNATI